MSQQKCYISRSILRIFKNFFWLKEENGGYCGWEFQVRRNFFYRSNVATFPTSRKCKNFNFSLYTVLEEMLYLQKYLTNFQRLFLSKRRERWLLWLKISSAQIFWFSNSNVTTFPTSRKGKNFNFSFCTFPEEMLYLQKNFTNFLKFFLLKEEEPGYCGSKFQVHRYFGLAIATLKLFQHPENVKIKIYSFSLSQKKCYISRRI